MIFKYQKIIRISLRMKKTISVTTHEKQEKEDKLFWKKASHEKRLDLVEILRIESGKFIYEYPARLQRVLTVIRKA